jgi:hypothetical protein
VWSRPERGGWGATSGATFKWSKGGTLPKGLKLSAAGVLSGVLNKKLATGTVPLPVKLTETAVTSTTNTKGKPKNVTTKTTATETLTVTVN